MVLAFGLQAIGLFLVVAVGQTSAAMFSLTLVLVYFTWGEIYSLFPRHRRRLLRDAARHLELRGALQCQGRCLDHRRVVRGAALEQSGSWAMGFYGSAVVALVAAALAAFVLKARATAPGGGGGQAAAK